MGVGVVSVGQPMAALRQDSAEPDSVHDVGASMIPMFVARGTANVYDFHRNQVPGALQRDVGYFRDVGTVDDYYDAHMDLVSVHPLFNLYNQEWPILSVPPIWPPAKFTQNGTELDSMVSPGTIISGGTVTGSVVFDNVGSPPRSTLPPQCGERRTATIDDSGRLTTQIADDRSPIPDRSRILNATGR